MMKIQKGADEEGLVAELLKNSPGDLQIELSGLFNDIPYVRSNLPLGSIAEYDIGL